MGYFGKMKSGEALMPVIRVSAEVRPTRRMKGPPFGEAQQGYAHWIIASLKSQGGRAPAREIIRHHF
jgi:hypothetical protein